MSVNVGQRAKSPLEAQVKTDELVTYTIKILSNERTFNPKYQALADMVIDTAVDALVCIDEANRRVARLIRLEAQGLRDDGTSDMAYEGWRAHALKGTSFDIVSDCDQWYADKKGKTC